MLTGVYLALSGGFALAYAGRFAPRNASVPRAMLKALAYGALAMACLIEGAMILSGALVLLGAGDLALQAGPRRARGWLAAGCLIGGQALLALSFLIAGGAALTPGPAAPLQIGLIAALATFLWRAWPRLEGLRAAGVAYAAAAGYAALLGLGLPGHSLAAALGVGLALAGDGLVAAAALGLRMPPGLRLVAPWASFALQFLGRGLIAAPSLMPAV